MTDLRTTRAMKAIDRVVSQGRNPYDLTSDDWLGEPRVGVPTYAVIAGILSDRTQPEPKRASLLWRPSWRVHPHWLEPNFSKINVHRDRPSFEDWPQKAGSR